MGAAQIATTLGSTARTVVRVRARWRSHGLASLDDRSRPGRPPCVTAEMADVLARVAEEDPRRHGYAFVRWTAPRLTAHLTRTTGVKVSSRWVAVLLRERDLVWRRSKRTIRNLQDPAAMARARRTLRELKKRHPSPSRPSNCGSAMGSASIGFP